MLKLYNNKKKRDRKSMVLTVIFPFWIFKAINYMSPGIPNGRCTMTTLTTMSGTSMHNSGTFQNHGQSGHGGHGTSMHNSGTFQNHGHNIDYVVT
jgi:hypothetical protein